MCLFSQLCVSQKWSQKLEQVDQQLLKQNPALEKKTKSTEQLEGYTTALEKY